MSPGRTRGKRLPEKAPEEHNHQWAEVREWIDELQREWAQRRKAMEALREKEPYRLPEDSFAE